MSATYSTPKFLTSLAKLAKENRVSNKDVKAKKAAKIQRVKDIQRQHKIAAKMDKELTKLEKVAAKEEAKQAKIEAKEEAKQAKIQAKEEAKTEAKQAKTNKKTAAKLTKQTKNEERTDIIRTICENLGHTNNATLEVTA